MKKLFFLFVMVFALLAGCRPMTPYPTETSIPSVTPTPQPTPTIIPSTTPLVPFRVETSCWPVESLKQGGNIKGSLVFQANSPNQYFAWDISSFQSKTLKEITGFGTVNVSPDGAFIAGVPRNGNELLLISSSKIRSFPIPQLDYPRVGFLYNGLIFISVDRDYLWGHYENGTGFTDRNYILDPATGKLTPGYVFLPGFTYGTHYSFPIDYSPDMHYVIYQNTPNTDGSPRFTLLDLTNNEIVWTGPKFPAGLSPEYSVPAWKPNTNTLIYPLWSDWHNGYSNYYSISVDGIVAQLTRFNQASVLNFGINNNLPLPRWSPDGRYLVFLVYDAVGRGLYIWDDQQKVAFSPCLPHEAQAFPSRDAYWSFDGNHLLINLQYPVSAAIATPDPIGMPGSRNTYLILDMITKTIFELPNSVGSGTNIAQISNSSPIGWLNWHIP